MVRGKLGEHSVGGGRAKKPKHTKRARAPTNKCVHGNWPTLCLQGCGEFGLCAWVYEFQVLEGLRWGLVVCAWVFENRLRAGLRWEFGLCAWVFENRLLEGLRWGVVVCARVFEIRLQGTGLRWWLPLCAWQGAISMQGGLRQANVGLAFSPRRS
jgi:hypothetical protein